MWEDRRGEREHPAWGRGGRARRGESLVAGAQRGARCDPGAVHCDEEVMSWFSAHVAATLELWVAEEQREVCGLMVLDGNWIDELYVDPESTGRGIGSRLVEIAKRERPHSLRLWTFVSNRRARRFYERHGFVEVDRTDGSANEERAPDIQYAWFGGGGCANRGERRVTGAGEGAAS